MTNIQRHAQACKAHLLATHQPTRSMEVLSEPSVGTLSYSSAILRLLSDICSEQDIPLLLHKVCDTITIDVHNPDDRETVVSHLQQLFS